MKHIIRTISKQYARVGKVKSRNRIVKSDDTLDNYILGMTGMADNKMKAGHK